MSKVIFCVPPISKDRGVAQATQNRQAQFFRDPTFIFPVIPATFLTMIVQAPNNEVFWLDCVAEDVSEDEFYQVLRDMKPEWLVLESNTMLIKRYYEVIKSLKEKYPLIKVILTGEHVTACPEEVKANCKADFFIHGGKWFNEAFKTITGEAWPKDRLLPHIDRTISRSWFYAYDNGNFKKIPATYTMAAMDCWYRPKQACTFCTWVHYHPENVIRPVEDFLTEVESLINQGFKEFFDDSGTFPVGKWLHTFCNEMIERGYNKYIVWGCNMRFGALQPEDFKLMREAGCRFILWGFESTNQSTLDKLHKGTDIKDMKKDLIISHMVGIWNHLTVMMGYWWETLEEERRTYKMVRWLLLNGYASSMQSTIFMPYPGTAAFKQAKEEGVLIDEDWNKWDMTKPVVKLKYDFKDALKLQRDYYRISYHWKFWFQKTKRIKDIDDIKYYWRLSKKVINRFAGLHD